MIRVLFFARVREQMGCDQLELEFGDLRTLEDVRVKLQARFPDKAQHLGAKDLLVARNQEMSSWSCPLQDGDEVALFPPVTGG